MSGQDVHEQAEVEYEEILDITVESLVGTVFEMRLSSRETIANIKGRLQRLEGIPRQQMHLLHRDDELPDGLTLEQCGVTSGATLKLILALRGGPINTRRVPLPPSSQQASAASSKRIPPDLREEIMNKVPKNGQVTVVLFRDGDRVNMYQVIDNNADGDFTPVSSRSSQHNTEEDVDPELETRLRENAVTMTKMSDLRKQLQNLNMAKKKKKHRKSKGGRNKGKGTSDPFNISTDRGDVISKGANFRRTLSTITLPPITKNGNNTDDELSSTTTTTTSILPLNSSTAANMIKNAPSSRRQSFNSSLNNRPLQRVPEWLDNNKANLKHDKNNSSSNVTKRKKKKKSSRHQQRSVEDEAQIVDVDTTGDHDNKNNNSRLISTDIAALSREMTGKPVQVHRRNRRRHRNKSERDEDGVETDDMTMSTTSSRLGGAGRRSSTKSLSLRGSLNSAGLANPAISASAKTRIDFVDELKHEAEAIFYTDKDHGNPELEEFVGDQENQHLVDETLNQTLTKSRPSTRAKSSRNSHRGPSFATGRPGSGKKANNRKKTPRPRCAHAECRKKLNITNGFPCRCQRVFCAKHRHPESHDCDFDYKTEGRSILEKANPPLALPKLPKI